MEKFVLNMIGGGFQHDVCSCANNVPKHVVWDKKNHEGNVSIHIDRDIFSIRPDPSKFNIAWFAESPFFLKYFTDNMDDWANYLTENYKLILTYNKNLIKRYSFLKYAIPTAQPWVKNRNIHPKSKLISIIASWKNDAPGHQFRHQIINEYKPIMDIFGSGYNKIELKDDGLMPYRFSFAIENFPCDGYFTEKIADCFATGTIPIYWGDPSISDYFNPNGIITVNDDFDITLLNEEIYNLKKEYIQENFDKIMSLPCPEDYIYITYLK